MFNYLYNLLDFWYTNISLYVIISTTDYVKVSFYKSRTAIFM